MPSEILVQEQDGTPKQIVFADHAGELGLGVVTVGNVTEARTYGIT